MRRPCFCCTRESVNRRAIFFTGRSSFPRTATEQNEPASGRHCTGLQCERRRKSRTQGSIPARVHGVDPGGREFDLDAIMENLSAGGLYLSVPGQVDERARLSVSFFLPTDPGQDCGGTYWEALGIIRRVEPQTDGSNGLGIEFTSYREI